MNTTTDNPTIAPPATWYGIAQTADTVWGWAVAIEKIRVRILEAWERIQRGEPSGYPLSSIDQQIVEWREPGVERIR